MDAIQITAPLQREDEKELDGFLALHSYTSMHLRADLACERARNNFAIARQNGRIVGAAVQLPTGMIALQAPAAAGELSAAILGNTRWRLAGFFGPPAQVRAARTHLGAEATSHLKDADEVLFALKLDELRLPPVLATNEVACRVAVDSDIELLVDWRIAFRKEAMGDLAGPDLDRSSRADIVALVPAGRLFILEGPEPLACCSFNAWLPDMVQIGNVWTPPSLRGNGYARAVVAGALDLTRRSGTTAAVLSTAGANLAAQAAYRSIGFHLVVDYVTERISAASQLPSLLSRGYRSAIARQKFLTI